MAAARGGLSSGRDAVGGRQCAQGPLLCQSQGLLLREGLFATPSEDDNKGSAALGIIKRHWPVTAKAQLHPPRVMFCIKPGFRQAKAEHRTMDKSQLDRTDGWDRH